MTKHTPGPWIATHNSWDFSDVFGPDGKSVALCQISPYVTKDTQKDLEPIKEANARLIAAAPSLYEYVASKADCGDNEAIKLLEMIDGRT